MSRHSVLVCALVMAGIVASLPAQTPMVGGPDQMPAPSLAPQQLDNLVAPIALYPDPLLGQVLAASTYPVELVEAQQWLVTNGGLGGQQLMDAARQQNWDPSVQALVAMPEVITMLTQDIHWTTDLGNAFLAQEADVMSAVQRMRQRAQANGQLQSNRQETVTTENQGGQQAIEIQPADPQVIYVPAYDPYYVYGWGSYPPLYYPDGYWFEPGIGVGLYFGGWGGWGYGGGWGWGTNWFGRSLYVNGGFFNRYGYRNRGGFAGGFGASTMWSHDPGHRLGASYPNGPLTSRYGAASQASRMAAGRSGGWRSFGGGGGGNVGSGNSFRGATPQANTRGAQNFQGSSNGRQNYRSQSPTQPPNQQRFQGTTQRYQGGPQQRAQAPAQRSFQAPAQQQRSFQAPAQRSAPSYQAPQRSFQSAPRMSAPSAPRMSAPNSGGGGGSRNMGGGGSRNSGGGGHGGGRR